MIQGNFIGTDVSGRRALGNEEAGIWIDLGATLNTIGGPGPAAGNTIAFNSGPGVMIADGTRNAIRGNSILGNSGLAIDFGSGKVILNDAGDADGGPNNKQNFPVLASAVSTGQDVTVQGTLQSRANSVFDLDFYDNRECSASGYGEGENFLGSVEVTTDANGEASFNVTFPASAAAGRFITATANDARGNTSQFSQCLQVSAAALSTKLMVTRHATSDSLILSWPASSPGFILETTDNLAPAAVWLKVAESPSVAGDWNSVTIKPSNRSSFYRLRRP